MGTDSSGAAYATPAGSVSEGVEPPEADMTPAMGEWATDMWHRVAPQLVQPAVKVTISKSGGISRASSTPSPQIPTGKPRAVMEELRKQQEAEEKRKKAEAKAKIKAKAEKEKETSSSSSTDFEISSTEEEEPEQKIQAKKKGQKKPTQKAIVKTPSGTKGGRGKRMLADNARFDGDATPVNFECSSQEKTKSIASTRVGEYITGMPHHEYLHPFANDGGRKPKLNDHNGYKIKRNHNGSVE